MLIRFIAVAFIAIARPSVVQAQVQLISKCEIVFATVDEGQATLRKRDDFVTRLSPFDRSARLKTDREVTEAQYLDFAASAVLPWTDEEKNRVIPAIEAVSKKLEGFALPWPEKIQFIKTSGNEEGQAAYTRSTAVILPQSKIKPGGLAKLVCHELFHVLSRNDDALRDRLYAAIGFEACEEVDLPSSIKVSRITNPDAPRNAHCIQLTVEGQPRWAIPILFANSDRYDSKRGGEFFDYLSFKLLLVDRTPGSKKVQPSTTGDEPQMVDPRSATGFMEQIGRNTGYIIHPEEVLADNFVLIVLGDPTQAPSPEIAAKIKAALETK